MFSQTEFMCVYNGPPWALEENPYQSGEFALILEDGTVHRLTNPEINIGRAPDCFVCVSNGSVSRNHAFLHCRSGKWFLEDRGSLNGTALNGRRLAVQQQYPLQDGDRITLSEQVTLWFRKQDSQPAGGSYPRTFAISPKGSW